jgi:lysozyme
MQELIGDLIKDEGLRLKPYRCTAGKLTVGIGRNLEDVGLTEEEARYLLKNDIARIERDLDALIPWWRSLSSRRQRALGNMAFQLGANGLKKFSQMLNALEDGDYEKAANEALDSMWAKQTPARAQRIAQMMREG